MKDLRERLRDGHVHIIDGAMGTMLYQRGFFVNVCYDELNLSRPELVRGVHEAYLRAGAEILETNTFGSNPVKLSSHGLEDRTEEINRVAAGLARQAAGDLAFVLGSVGPLGTRIEPWGPTSRDEATAYFARQITGLLEGDVDGFILETFADVDELQAAVNAARALSNLPVVAQMSFGVEGSSAYGTPVELFAERMAAFDVDVIGLNCAVGPAPMLETIERLAAVTDRPISALPNAGLPRSVAGRIMYLSSPEYMGRYARRMIEAGVRIIGGCCGTTPAHIREIRSQVVSMVPRRTAAPRSPAASRVEAHEPLPLVERSRLGAKLSGGQFVIATEVLPPRGWKPDEMLARCRELRDAGVDVVHVLDTPLAKSRMGVVSAAGLIEREVGVETVFHYTCRDRNMLGMQADLLGAAAAGLTFAPPEGAACGVTAALTVAEGAWVAPANHPLKGVLAARPAFSPAAEERLLAAGVNVIRHDPRGFLTLGAATLSGEREVRPIPVRRTLVLLGRLALAEGLRYVFEPHDADFRRLVRRRFERLLADLYTRGALAGRTPDEAFRVVTGEALNTAASVEAGRFFVELRVAPSRPLAFLTVRLVQSSPELLALREV